MRTIGPVYLSLLLASILLSSCASIVNSPYKKVQFFSETERVPFSLNEDSTIYYTDTVIPVKRSSNPIIVRVNPEENTEIYIINSRLSTSYVLGNICTYFLGYVFDLFSPKMHSYPNKVELSNSNGAFMYPLIGDSKTEASEITSRDLMKIQKKKIENRYTFEKINLSLNLLSVQFFNWDTRGGRDNNNAAFALGLGAEYYLKPDFYLSGGIDGMYHQSFQMLSVWEYDTSNTSKALQGKVQVGKKLYKQLWFDAGLQMNHTYWNTKEVITGYDSWMHLILSPIVGSNIEHIVHYKEIKNNYGLAFGLKLRSGKSCIRIDYNPSFLTQRANGWKWEYNHIWGISFGGLIKLK